VSFRELEPRASRLWIRFAPRRWPAAGRPWLDVAERRIVWPAAGRAAELDLPAGAAASPDVVLLPPLEKARTREKQSLCAALVAEGCAVLAQHTMDDERIPKVEGVLTVEDLLFPLLENNVAALDAVTPESILLVPLISGLSAVAGEWGTLLDRLAKRSPAAVVGLAPELSPIDRRRLVEQLGEDSFERVHHPADSEPEIERSFARAVVAAGLSPFFERPAARLAPRTARNRRLAAALFEAGERWLALGRSEADGAALLAAARHVESAVQDLEALARERQLAHLPFLSAIARREIEQFAETGRSRLVAELRAEWVGAGVAA